MYEIFVVGELFVDTFIEDWSNNVCEQLDICKYGYIGGKRPIRRATSYSVGVILIVNEKSIRRRISPAYRQSEHYVGGTHPFWVLEMSTDRWIEAGKSVVGGFPKPREAIWGTSESLGEGWLDRSPEEEFPGKSSRGRIYRCAEDSPGGKSPGEDMKWWFNTVYWIL